MRRMVYLALCLLVCLPILVPLTSLFQWQSWKEWMTRRVRIDVRHIIRQMSGHIPPHHIALAFRQSDFGYYGGTKFVDHNDPRMMDLYRTDRVDLLHQKLSQQKIGFIVLPPYGWPTWYNTAFCRLTADPVRCPLVLENRQYRLYRLSDPAQVRQPGLARQPLTFHDFRQPPAIERDWIDWLGDLPSHLAWSFNPDPMAIAFTPQPERLTLRNHTRLRCLLYSGDGPLRLPPMDDPRNPRFHTEPNTAYLLNVGLRGRGWVSIYVYEYTTPREYDTRAPIQKHLIYDGVLHGGGNTESITRGGQWISSAKTENCRVVVMLSGRGWVEVSNLRLDRVEKTGK